MTEGERLRAGRAYAGYSLRGLAKETAYSAGYLGQVETGVRPATPDVIAAYESVLGGGMRRRDITHPKLRKIENDEHLDEIRRAVESGDPSIFADGPTSSTIDAAVAPIISEAGVEHFRRWAKDGKTSTLRANAVSIVGFLPGRDNAELVAEILTDDDRVRRLCLASEVSRLMQWDWETSLRVAEDPVTAPDPGKLAGKLSKEAIDPKDSESRWCAGWLLQRLAPALAQH
ncbi:transcriptional regulator [Amycolatopsis antarctica]|uniref:Transcriptional regulator n=2 Tax=Amycolatopsis antarctica TaxID=1854586 RepID=A0A263CZ25_9PSEU|nr:transcriptional regulator [Amycolatopsis antarctica]